MKLRIPQQGLIGEVALREAVATELRAVIDLVRAAVGAAMYPNRPAADCYVSLEAIYPDRAVASREGRLWSYPYTLGDDNKVTLGQPQEVVLDHKPVTLREAAAGVFIESVDTAGTRWTIRVIKAGLSGNNNYYPDAVLREATPLFEGVRVFVKSDDEHINGQGKAFSNLIGRVTQPRFIEGASTDTGEIRAVLELLESAGDVPAKLREAHARGMAADLFGFSIDAAGMAKKVGNRRVATSITKVKSVDLIIEPGAGGQLINLIEAVNPEEQTEMNLRQRMIEAIKRGNKGQLPAGLNVDDDTSLETAYREALTKHRGDEEGADAGEGSPADAQLLEALDERMDKRLQMVETRANARVRIAESNLPKQAKDKLRKHFDALTTFTEAAVDQAIADERTYLASFTESGRVSGLGDAGRVEGGEDRAEKVTKMLDDFFAAKKGGPTSFKECYVEITGDRRVTGQLRDCDPARLREAVRDELFREAVNSATFANVLGDSITRRMIADYAQNSRYEVWRNACEVVPVSDFRTQERTRMGGYGDLPAVGQGQPYGPLTTPSDEKATYAISKRGGTEEVTLEAIRNDDVGAIRQIPIKLSRAAKRTLSKFVLDMVKDNPTLYDGVAFFHASHGNLGSAALSAAAVAAARLAVLKQTELSSNDRIGVPPVNLWVPFDLEEAAFDLFRRATNNDTDFVESLQMRVHPVWYWTDATDWATSCDPAEVPGIEIAFLDGNEEPELFVQDNPTQGSMFSHDKVTYKLRHTYGGNVKEYRGWFKSVVAG